MFFFAFAMLCFYEVNFANHDGVSTTDATEEKKRENVTRGKILLGKASWLQNR